MDAQTYRNHIETTVLDEAYEPTTNGSTGEFDTVWHKRTEDPTIGITDTFVTVVDADIDQETIKQRADDFRALLSGLSPSDPGSMENLFGYVIFAAADPSEELIEFATQEYTVADRRTSVFPLVYDLAAETLHTHAVPRLKGRGFFEKQKLDAESLFSI